MGNAIMINVTTGSDTEAQTIAQALVEARIAACVQAQPVRSTFRWDGAVSHESEVLLVIKTRASLFDAVERLVRTHHSYDVPEIVAVPIVHAGADYLAWLEAETEPTQQ